MEKAVNLWKSVLGETSIEKVEETYWMMERVYAGLSEGEKKKRYNTKIISLLMYIDAQYGNSEMKRIAFGRVNGLIQ